MDAFVYDEKDSKSPHFHGLPMKAVDVLVELEDRYLFIEIKHFDDVDEYNTLIHDTDQAAQQKRRNGFRWLKGYLTYKFRDTFLARFAEGKVNKPVYYFCLINFEDALNQRLWKALYHDLPVKKQRRWT